MKNLQTYELFNGGNIVKSLEKDLQKHHNLWNELMVAIVYNDYDEFKYELSFVLKTMELEKEDKYGNTALLLAAKEGRLKMLKELIKIGANIYHKNKKGEDFHDLAINRFKFINGVKDWIEKNYPEFVMAKKYNL